MKFYKFGSKVQKQKHTAFHSYELGGPTTYTYREIYEMFFNYANMQPYCVSIPMDVAFDYYYCKPLTSAIKLLFYDYLTPDNIITESLDRVVLPGAKT